MIIPLKAILRLSTHCIPIQQLESESLSDEAFLKERKILRALKIKKYFQASNLGCSMF